jgi:hypothetical protein
MEKSIARTNFSAQPISWEALSCSFQYFHYFHFEKVFSSKAFFSISLGVEVDSFPYHFIGF